MHDRLAEGPASNSSTAHTWQPPERHVLPAGAHQCPDARESLRAVLRLRGRRWPQAQHQLHLHRRRQVKERSQLRGAGAGCPLSAHTARRDAARGTHATSSQKPCRECLCQLQRFQEPWTPTRRPPCVGPSPLDACPCTYPLGPGSSQTHQPPSLPPEWASSRPLPLGLPGWQCSVL